MGNDQTAAQQPPLLAPPPGLPPPPPPPPPAALPSSSPQLRPFSALTATFPSSATIASASISHTRPPGAAALHSPLALPSSAPAQPSTARLPSSGHFHARLRLERASASAAPRPALPNAEQLRRTISSVSAVSSASPSPLSSPSSSPSSCSSPSSQPPPPSSAPSSAPSAPPHRSDDVELIAELLSILTPQQAAQAAGGGVGSEEEARLDSFLVCYARCYSFPSALHQSLFSSLCTHRLLSPAFDSGSISRQHRLRILRTLRVLTRDSGIQRLLMRERQPLQALAEQFRRLVPEFFSLDPPYCSEMLVEICSVFKRIAERGSWQRRLFSCGVPELLVQLLSCRDAAVLQSVLLTLIHLSSSSLFLQEMLKLPCIDPLLQLIQERNATTPAAAPAAGGASPSSASSSGFSFPAAPSAGVALPPPLSSSSSASSSSSLSSSSSTPSSESSSSRYQCLAGELLELMCVNHDCRHEVRMQGGNRILVSLLMAAAGDEVLQALLLRCLASMALDEDSSREIRYLGGIPLLLQLIACERGRDGRWQTPSLQLSIAVCTALTHLANDDENATQICRQQGIVVLTQLLLVSAASPPPSPCQLNAESSAHVLRTLRFLYSIERNRKAFKRLFPSSLFAVFVDVGHWQYELRLYEEAVLRLQSLRSQERQQMWAAMDELRQAASDSRANRRLIRGYAVMEVLGRGGFGTVYRVVKEGGESAYAMKEISLRSIATAHSGEEREAELRLAVERMLREVDILSQLDHPNIVRYYSSFVDGGCLYIVMELVEGQSLLEYVTGCADRRQAVSEEIIWPVFIQLCLALSYLHIDKQVVHRDLSCNNIMIDPRRRVKVMDLGLALQRRGGDAAADAGGGQLTEAPMGTVAFSCPELVSHQAYSDKADIWSLGCVLYQMATGRPAFGGDNPLAVAQKVVRGVYAPLDAAYSPLLHEMVKRLLTVDPRQRPDILQVCFLLSPLMMAQLDRVRGSCLRLEAELQHEQETRKKEMDEWTREKQAWRKIVQNRGAGGGGQQLQLQQPQARSSQQQDQQQQALAVVPLASSQSLAVLRSEEYLTTEPSSGSSTGSEGATPTPLPPAASAGVLPSSQGRSRQQSMLSISPTRMRPIADPVSELLCQLHKVVWISQLPPSLSKDAKRSVVCRYKQALFRQPHWRSPLKQEMWSLLTMQPAFIHSRWGINCDDIASAAQAAASSSAGASSGNSGSGSGGGPLASGSSSAVLPVSSRLGLPRRLTYEDLHLVIEQVLKEEGYYAVGGELDVDMELAAAAAVAGGAGGMLSGSSGHLDWSERDSGRDEKRAVDSEGERSGFRLQRGGDQWSEQQLQQQVRDSEPSDGDAERERASQRRRQHHSASKARQRAAAAAAEGEEKLQPAASPSASTSPPRRHRLPTDASSARKESGDGRHRESRRRKEEGRTPRKDGSASAAAAPSREKEPRRLQDTKPLVSAAASSSSSTSSSAASSATSSPRLFPSGRRLSASSTQSQPLSRNSDAVASSASASPSPSPSPPRLALTQSMSQLSLSSRALPPTQQRPPPSALDRPPRASRILFSSVPHAQPPS